MSNFKYSGKKYNENKYESLLFNDIKDLINACAAETNPYNDVVNIIDYYLEI